MTQERDDGDSVPSVLPSAVGQSTEDKEDAKTDLLNTHSHQFNKIWREVTSDHHLTLYGFRRYRTTHLLNLRFSEADIDRIDHDLY